MGENYITNVSFLLRLYVVETVMRYLLSISGDAIASQRCQQLVYCCMIKSLQEGQVSMVCVKDSRITVAGRTRRKDESVAVIFSMYSRIHIDEGQLYSAVLQNERAASAFA